MAFIGYTLGTYMRIGYDPDTGESGTQYKITNKSGATSVKGTICDASHTTTRAFGTLAADGVDPVYIVYEAGVADGSACWVWTEGSICEVLLEDSTAATLGYWAKVSDTANGRADCTNAAPPGGTIAALEDHTSEIGHCLESVSAGTDALALIHFHTN